MKKYIIICIVLFSIFQIQAQIITELIKGFNTTTEDIKRLNTVIEALGSNAEARTLNSQKVLKISNSIHTIQKEIYENLILYDDEQKQISLYDEKKELISSAKSEVLNAMIRAEMISMSVKEIVPENSDNSNSEHFSKVIENYKILVDKYNKARAALIDIIAIDEAHKEKEQDSMTWDEFIEEQDKK